MFASLWNNPFTTASGAATAVLAILHGFGVNTFGLDSGTLATIFAGVTGLLAKDSGTK